MLDTEKQFLEQDRESGNLLESLLRAQQLKGYLTKSQIEIVAAKYQMKPAKVYETASFYSMLKTKPEGRIQVEICRSAPCHVAGARAVVAATEEKLGIKVGETSADGNYSFKYCECLGHCQAGPTLLVNGTLHDHLKVEDVSTIIDEAGKLA